MAGQMVMRIWDVEHGACAMVTNNANGVDGRLAMIDSGCTADWNPSTYIKTGMKRSKLDYLFITNADQDHMSDLQRLTDKGIEIGTFYRNRTYTDAQLRAIKVQGGPLTKDAQQYLNLHSTHVHPVTEQFNDYMGGVKEKVFWNSYPAFTDTNNLSLVVFLNYGPFKVIFPGDLETAGWESLLQDQDFRNELMSTTIFVAAHHGRENGYCADAFKYCKPQVVVMSDKAIVHDTQGMTQTYRNHVLANHKDGVFVATTQKQRHVLTTRRDGWIQFSSNDQGTYTITTEYAG